MSEHLIPFACDPLPPVERERPWFVCAGCGRPSSVHTLITADLCPACVARIWQDILAGTVPGVRARVFCFRCGAQMPRDARPETDLCGGCHAAVWGELRAPGDYVM